MPSNEANRSLLESANLHLYGREGTRGLGALQMETPTPNLIDLTPRPIFRNVQSGARAPRRRSPRDFVRCLDFDVTK